MQYLRSQAGFTLVELMAAIAILAIGMLGAATLVITSYRQDTYNTRVRHAESLAASKIEELRGKTADIPSLTALTPPAVGTQDCPTGADQVYSRQWTIRDPSTTGVTGMTRMMEVDVIVGWPSDGGTSCGCKPDKSTIKVTTCPYQFRMTGIIVQK
jgi:prepilin-type N-terminal cleavage/methylation domain-containing protein